MPVSEIETVGKVIGPMGNAMTIEDIPERGTTRWVARRKAEVVAAVAGGLLSVRQACERYDLSLEELSAWQRAVDRDGMPGLRAKRVQEYRKTDERSKRRVGA